MILSVLARCAFAQKLSVLRTAGSLRQTSLFSIFLSCQYANCNSRIQQASEINPASGFNRNRVFRRARNRVGSSSSHPLESRNTTLLPSVNSDICDLEKTVQDDQHFARNMASATELTQNVRLSQIGEIRHLMTNTGSRFYDNSTQVNHQKSMFLRYPAGVEVAVRHRTKPRVSVQCATSSASSCLQRK